LKFSQSRLNFEILAKINTEGNNIGIFYIPLYIKNIFILLNFIVHMIELHICIKLKQKSEYEYELIAVRYAKVCSVFLLLLRRIEFSYQIFIYALN
jgi:hypothetical protein